MYFLAERKAIHEFHGDEVGTFVLPDLKDLRNVGMAESCRRLGFSNETLHPIAIRRDLCGKNL